MKAYESRSEAKIEQAFREASDRYAEWGIAADAAVDRALGVPISLHCWQADDVTGFETRLGPADGGGILATGNYPGRARNGDEMRQDLDQVIGLLPGVHRANLHAFHRETGDAAVERDQLEPAHFSRWIDWARETDIGLDFNPTYFSHPRADDGFTLSHPDPEIRSFWIRHGIASRRIAEHMGREVGSPCVNNHWIPDGAKDTPADRWAPRERLIASYDAIFAPDLGIEPALCVDTIESKLFGLGSEDYVVGSMEFCTAYALSRKIVQCLDMGHYHPTEMIHDKISSLLQFHDRLLIHASRPIRWDSDHVVVFNDDLRNVFLEVVRGNALDRVYVALDFFDASINRIAAYVIGARATRKAILAALLDPSDLFRRLEAEGKGAQKLGLMEEAKTLPFAGIWDMVCLRAGIPVGAAWIPAVEDYEEKTLTQRG